MILFYPPPTITRRRTQNWKCSFPWDRISPYSYIHHKVQDALAALIGTVLLLTCDSSAVIPECSICACNIWNAFFLLMNKEIVKHYRLLRQQGKLNSTNTIAASFMYNKVLKPLDVQDKITNATFPLSFVYNNLLTGFV